MVSRREMSFMKIIRLGTLASGRLKYRISKVKSKEAEPFVEGLNETIYRDSTLSFEERYNN